MRNLMKIFMFLSTQKQGSTNTTSLDFTKRQLVFKKCISIVKYHKYDKKGCTYAGRKIIALIERQSYQLYLCPWLHIRLFPCIEDLVSHCFWPLKKFVVDNIFWSIKDRNFKLRIRTPLMNCFQLVTLKF